MTDVVEVALIAAVPSTLAAAAAVWNAIHVRRYKNEVVGYKLEINSRMDELMRVKGEIERALGVQEGIEQERGRIKLE